MNNRLELKKFLKTRKSHIPNCPFCSLNLLRMKVRSKNQSYCATDYVYCVKCDRIFKEGLNIVKFNPQLKRTKKRRRK